MLPAWHGGVPERRRENAMGPIKTRRYKVTYKCGTVFCTLELHRSRATDYGNRSTVVANWDGCIDPPQYDTRYDTRLAHDYSNFDEFADAFMRDIVAEGAKVALAS